MPQSRRFCYGLFKTLSEGLSPDDQGTFRSVVCDPDSATIRNEYPSVLIEHDDINLHQVDIASKELTLGIVARLLSGRTSGRVRREPNDHEKRFDASTHRRSVLISPPRADDRSS